MGLKYTYYRSVDFTGMGKSSSGCKVTACTSQKGEGGVLQKPPQRGRSPSRCRELPWAPCPSLGGVPQHLPPLSPLPLTFMSLMMVWKSPPSALHSFSITASIFLAREEARSAATPPQQAAESSEPASFSHLTRQIQLRAARGENRLKK